MGPKILFVDDDKEDEELMRDILEQLKSSDYSFCSDGKAALCHLATLANHELPDLVVSDLHLPGIDGLELVKALKAHESFRGIWVVIYSGSITPATKIKLDEAGIKEIFQKPANVQELENILTRIIHLATEHHKQLTSLVNQ